MEKERLRGRVTARITLAEFVDEVRWPQKAGMRANTRQGYERDLRSASSSRSAIWSSSRSTS